MINKETLQPEYPRQRIVDETGPVIVSIASRTVMQAQKPAVPSHDGREGEEEGVEIFQPVF